MRQRTGHVGAGRPCLMTLWNVTLSVAKDTSGDAGLALSDLK